MIKKIKAANLMKVLLGVVFSLCIAGCASLDLWLSTDIWPSNVNERDKNGNTPLYNALYSDKIEAAKLLIENGADVNAKHRTGSMRLLAWAISNSSTEAAKLLIENGADVNAENENGWTPLSGAVDKGKTELVKLLIENGADVNEKNEDGKTLLSRVADWGKIEFAKLLIENGADVNEKDRQGETLLYRTINWGADWGRTEFAKLLIENGADVNEKSKKGWTPLSRAADWGNTDRVKLLIENGADVNAKDNFGYTPLSRAADWGKTETVKVIKQGIKNQDRIQKRLAEEKRIAKEKRVKELPRVVFNTNLHFELTHGYSVNEKEYYTAPFKAIQSITQSLVTKYLTLKDKTFPKKIKQPAMPTQLKLVQGKFEANKFFEVRVQNEIKKRDAVIKQLQADYRKRVDKRNEHIAELKKEKEVRKQNLDEQILIHKSDALIMVMTGFTLKNPSYNRETNLLSFDLKSIRADYSERIAIEPNDPIITEKLNNNPDKIDTEVIFSLADNAVKLARVTLKYNNRVFVAQTVTADGKKEESKPLEVVLDSKKLDEDALFSELDALQEQNPNLVDRYRISAITYNDGRQINTTYTDDIPKLLKNVAAAPLDESKWLIVIGIENYLNTDSIIYSKRSAKLFSEVASKTLGIPKHNRYIFLDNQATAGNIKDRISLMLNNIKEGDTIYFYYSGHGIPALPDNEPFMLSQDKIPDFVVNDKFFKLKNFYKMLSDSKATKIIAFMDSCFSGATDGKTVIKGVAAARLAPKKVTFDQKKMVVITAGRKKQYSNMYQKRGHRLFTYFLMKSLLLGRTNVDEIHKEVHVNVKDVSRKMGDIKMQEPEIQGNSNLDL